MKRATLAWFAVSLAGPLLGLAAIWYAPIAHYWVGPSHLPAAVVERATAPLPGPVRDLLPARAFEVPVRAAQGGAAQAVRGLRESGRLQLGTFEPMPVTLPFAPGNRNAGGAGWHLQIVALAVPRLLLDAYRETGDRAYLEQARAALLAWARFEGAQWLPQGMLWNDHAVAARVFVLADFWQAYRDHPDLLTEAQAGRILAFAARAIALTARDGHYTPRTNHGIIQNLALWHAHLAFPGLPAAKEAARIARERFAGHLPYYLGPEGVILEHSAGYHAVGVKLVGRAFRYMHLAGQPIPAEWWRRYRAAVAFYRLLRRPDGSLPRIGDTVANAPASVAVARRVDGEVRLQPPPSAAPGHGAALFPVAGYWVGWRAETGQGASQLVAGWSHFREHGHKHADELGVWFWADGVAWWTAVGYWPYGLPGRGRAAGWDGANAPHLVGEAADSQRTARLLGHADGPVRFLDMERSGPGDYRVRRQVLSLPGGVWAVLDWARSERERASRAIWRTGPGVRVRPQGEGAFRLTAPGADGALRLWHGGAGQVQRVRGTEGEGVAGLAAVDKQPVAVDSLVLERPSGGGPSLWVWARESGRTAADGPRLRAWRDPAHWRLSLPGAQGRVAVSRSGEALRVVAPSGETRTVRLEAGPEVADSRAAIANRLAAMQARYGDFRPLMPYRVRMSGVAGGLVLFHLAAFWPLVWLFRGARVPALLALGGWLAFAGWLELYYFRF